MNRRKFFNFLPSAVVTSAASAAAVFTKPVEAEDVRGITIDHAGNVVVTNCTFNVEGEGPALLFQTKQEN